MVSSGGSASCLLNTIVGCGDGRSGGSAADFLIFFFLRGLGEGEGLSSFLFFFFLSHLIFTRLSFETKAITSIWRLTRGSWVTRRC